MIDITPREIEMFAKATEIQEMWQPECRDVITISGEVYFVMMATNLSKRSVVWTMDLNNGISSYITLDDDKKIVSHLCHEPRIRPTWIPSQEQLRDIEGDGHGAQIIDLYNFVRGFDVYPDGVATTFWNGTEAWLAMVMYKRFNKRWNDSDWVVVK